METNDFDLISKRAKSACRELRNLSIDQRLDRLRELKDAILARREEILDRIQDETGKARSDALMSEIFGTVDFLSYLIKQSHSILKDRKVHTSIALMGKTSWVYFEPMGTVLIISPWNYPFFQAVVPIALSFVTGNATLFKPSEHTPLKGLIEDLLSKSGFQDHWVQIVYGDGSTGSRLIDLKPEKIFFTGSVKTGKKVAIQAAQQLIPVELELGGKDPLIVFEDVNIQRAAAGAAWGALTNLGQSCTSTERVYIHADIYDKFKTELLKCISRLVQKSGDHEDNDLGRITVPFQCELIKSQLDEALERGGKELTGNKWDGKDLRIPPMIIEGADQDCKLWNEETFGPIIPISKFKSEQEVIELANRSPYGLSASVWSKDKTRATRVARAIETGNVSINNVMLTEGNPALPFGGVKNSGIGRYKGEFGFYNFTNIKSVLIDSDSKKIEANWFPYTSKKYQLFTKMMLGLFKSGFTYFLQFLISGIKLEGYSTKVGKNGREQ